MCHKMSDGPGGKPHLPELEDFPVVERSAAAKIMRQIWDNQQRRI